MTSSASETAELYPSPAVPSRRRRIFLTLAVLASALLAWEGLTWLIAYTDDAYVRSDLITIAPQVSGRITALHVRDNQPVRSGDLLFSIDPEPFQLTVAAKQARLDEIEAQAIADKDAIQVAQSEEGAAAAELTYAQESQRRVQTLITSETVSQQALDQANEALTRAQTAVEGARAAIGKAEHILAMHEAGIASARAELATARWELTQTEVHAPSDGTINNLTLRAGDTARAGEPIIGLVDATAWRIVANYQQTYLRRFHIGSTAWIWLDAHPWSFHRAHIAGIARAISREPEAAALLPYVAPTTDWIRLQHRFPVTLVLDNRPENVTLYMGADARTFIFP